jgi:hypothetical protein
MPRPPIKGGEPSVDHGQQHDHQEQDVEMIPADLASPVRSAAGADPDSSSSLVATRQGDPECQFRVPANERFRRVSLPSTNNSSFGSGKDQIFGVDFLSIESGDNPVERS